MNKLPQEHFEKIADLYRSGYNHDQIKAMGYSTHSITKALKMHGLTRKNHWTDYEINLLKSMREDGFSLSEIQDELERFTYHAVAKAASRYL